MVISAAKNLRCYYKERKWNFWIPILRETNFGFQWRSFFCVRVQFAAFAFENVLFFVSGLHFLRCFPVFEMLSSANFSFCEGLCKCSWQFLATNFTKCDIFSHKNVFVVVTEKEMIILRSYSSEETGVFCTIVIYPRKRYILRNGYQYILEFLKF